MHNATKLGRLTGILTLSEEAIDRIGTLALAVGSLLALVALMF